MQAKKTCAPKPPMRDSASAHERRCHKTTFNRAVEVQTTRTNGVPSLCVSPGLDVGIMARKPEQLPDPWLFDSEKLLNELGRIAELVDHIPIADSHATHFAINRAAQAIYDLREHLRFLLHLHREEQRSIRRQHEANRPHAVSAAPTSNQNIVPLHRPTSSYRKKSRNPNSDSRSAKRRRASSATSSKVA